MIEFLDSESLDSVGRTVPVSPNRVGPLCKSPSNKLRFADTSQRPNVIRWVDSWASGSLLTHTSFHETFRMIETKSGGKKLVIITYGNYHSIRGELHAYNTKTDELEWSVGDVLLPGMKSVIKAQGLTVDDQGHLLVCDTNNECVQMFRVADGKYLGPLIKEGEHNLGLPRFIGWSSRLSSLIVVDDECSEFCINTIKIERL